MHKDKKIEVLTEFWKEVSKILDLLGIDFTLSELNYAAIFLIKESDLNFLRLNLPGRLIIVDNPILNNYAILLK